ncbi:DUF5686 and carboxypeptidase regulatory-like domain-containing protein [Pedobacter sp. SYSU D00535]|uniref:DUF5686 and carboxypeptidase regulatory-like domain-containing protein n=1 Tax=Pedobacter sp. SYSU D00535 TaxID=2810308 RepID=UPI001A96A0CE|nr:DUF5686 and carboxypeptidase regulatory-like domain-containing protein [Pedobacter sp. SYSU D00535]
MVKHLIVFLLTISYAFSQESFEVSGRISDMKGDAVPFASVYVKYSSLSTMANEHGYYYLRLPKGTHTLAFRYVGYKQEERLVQLDTSAVLDVRMAPDVYELKEVNIGKKGDPSYKMIRNVITNRKYLREFPSYTCDVYTKGVQKLIKAPKKMLGQDVASTLKLDSNRRGIIYQSETKSQFYFQYPELKEIMLASKVAGDREGFSFNRALDLQVNLYHNLIQWKAWGNQSFVSPVADNAFSFYTYQLIGSSTISGHLIHKIKITPKSRFDPAFTGYIYLVGDDWRIYSVDLTLTKDARINFVDTLQISQQFSLVDSTHWLPSDITFRFKGKVLGFEFAGYYTGLYSNYNTNPKFPEGLFNQAIMEIPRDVNQKDSEWWSLNRPIPLTDEEEWNYRVKDSLEQKTQSKVYLDSVQKERNKFKPVRFATTGYTLNNFAKKSYWYFYPLNNTLFYNPNDKWGFDFRTYYNKQYGYKRSLEFEPNIRYSSGKKSLNMNAELTYRTDTLRHQSFTLRGGSDFLNLNNRGTINLFYNTLTSLFEGKNYLMLYKSNFASFSAQTELWDGFLITGGVEAARRFPLRNSANNPIFANAIRNLYNEDLASDLANELFPVNNAFSVETKLSYTYGQRYTRRPDGKIYEAPRFPTLKVTYRKGIPGPFRSVVNYDFVSADLYQDKIKTGLLGYSSFYLSTGKFLNTRSLFYPDIRHFSGNQTAVYNPIFPNFHFLDYYSYATDQRYYEAHYEHNFSGMFLKRIPLIRKLKLEEIIGGAYLTQPQIDYKEAYIGFQRLVFRFDYGFSWQPGNRVTHTYRLFYGF